jgi:hypothetical protein
MKHPPNRPPRAPSRRPPATPSGGSTKPARPLDSDDLNSGRRTSKERPPQLAKPSVPNAHRIVASSAAKRSRSDDHPAETSEIGFRKPPKSHSWRKGQSGNPKGRKKGSKNKRTIIISLMEGRLGRKIPDPKKLTAQEALLWKAIQRGLAGDAKAMAFAFKRYDDATASSWAGPVITTEDDRQVYEALRAKIRLEIEEENNAGE